MSIPWDLITSSSGEKYKENSSCPSTDPCGKPERMTLGSEPESHQLLHVDFVLEDTT